MSGIFSTLNTANKGMMASQTALQTTSHNISNANTEGYSRQRVELKADLAFNFAGVGQIGTGVKMESVIRVVNDYVSKQIRQENSILNRFAAKSEVLEHLEIIFNEPSDTGLNFNLGEVFAAWQELSKNPESLNFKTIVVEKSTTLTNTINHMMNQLNSLEDETIEVINKNVDEFNSIITQLETLNQQIYNVTVKGQIPNDLMDQRDLLLKNLSSISDFKADFDKFNRVEISIDGNKILGQDIKYEFSVDENGELSLINSSDESDIIKPVENASGQIKGYGEALLDIKARKDELTNFTHTMADAINGKHMNSNDSEEDYFFIFDNNGNISVNNKIIDDNNLVNAGKEGSTLEGDGSRALEIARLRNEKINGTTIEGAYRDIVTRIGISKEHADNMVSNQEVLVNQLELRRESSSGVSIDEEVTNLIKFQKAYEANAKVISVLAEMLDTLINRMGV